MSHPILGVGFKSALQVVPYSHWSGFASAPSAIAMF